MSASVMMDYRWYLFSAIYCFASTSSLVTYFRRRYDDLLVQDVNRVLSLSGKHVRNRENLKFLRKCLEQHVVPSDIKQRVRKAKPMNPADIEQAFVRDEVEKMKDYVFCTMKEYRRVLHDVCCKLSFLDRIRFCKLVSTLASRLEHQMRMKKDRTLHWLLKTQVGHGPLQHSTIMNLSSIELTETQKNVLCRGINFGVPRMIMTEEVKAEFEICWQELRHKNAVSNELREECRSTLTTLAHQYAGSRIDKAGFPLDREHLAALRALRADPSIVVTKPDKGNGVVVMDRSDYVAKMLTILSDEQKFQRLGEVETHDFTYQRERSLQAYLLRQYKDKEISEELYHRLRPVGASRPRMYGLPKTHKPGVPLRPILSMVNAPQHELAKWLATVLHPVVLQFGDHTVKDTFEFCANIDACAENGDITDSFMCSFDVRSLFTNIPLKETLKICLDTLYRHPGVPVPSIKESVLENLLLRATTGVEFSFDGIMYRQIDGVAMGSPLGPVLANIFVGYWEAQIPDDQWPLFYNRFVDDTFSIFLSQGASLEFFKLLNGLHPALSFTMEGEKNNMLPFMDVQVERVENEFVRSVYRKPTFTGLYTRWDSFSPTC